MSKEENCNKLTCWEPVYKCLKTKSNPNSAEIKVDLSGKPSPFNTTDSFSTEQLSKIGLRAITSEEGQRFIGVIDDLPATLSFLTIINTDTDIEEEFLLLEETNDGQFIKSARKSDIPKGLSQSTYEIDLNNTSFKGLLSIRAVSVNYTTQNGSFSRTTIRQDIINKKM